MQRLLVPIMAGLRVARHSCRRRHSLVHNFCKPDRVNAHLAALEMQTGGRRAATSNRRVTEDSDPPWPAGYERGVMADTVKKLSHEGQLAEAVEAMGVLVQANYPVSQSLLYTVIKACVVGRDLVLGRRVHALTIKGGYDLHTFLCNHILRMYASHARLQEAMDVFTMAPKPDAFMWSSIISAHVKHGQAKQAIQLYHEMRESPVKPDGHVFVAALQACARGADLRTGEQVHADVLASGVEPDLFVSNCLIDMYAKCGSLKDARRVFDGLGGRDVVTWTALIAGYSQQGMGQEALNLFSAMQEEGIAVPNAVTLVSLLQACARVGTPALEKGKQLHAQVREQGLQGDALVANSLVNMYSKCGKVEDAQRLFDGLGQKDVVTWTALIAGYSQQGLGQEALHLYGGMQEEGVAVPNAVTFVSLLQACASVGSLALEKGKQLHAQIGEQGLDVDVVVGGSLVNMYAKCGSLKDAQIVFNKLGQKNVVAATTLIAAYAKCGNLEDAQKIFDGLHQKDVVTWNAMIAGYSQQGMGQQGLHLYRALQDEGFVTPNAVTFVCLLQACAGVGSPALEKGKQLHAQIREQRLQEDVFVANSLVDMYAKCGSLEDAEQVFDGLPKKDVVTWNAMIAGYSQHGMGQEALRLYREIRKGGAAAPNSVTFVSLLQACASLGAPALEHGKGLHAQIGEQGLQADVVVGCSLVNMYAKCGSLEDAQDVFDGLGQKNVVTWNALIAGYSQQGMGQKAFHLYSAMQEEGIARPDCVTFGCLLQACASEGVSALEMGRQLHAQIKEQGVHADVFVANSLVNMYAKCGSLEDAEGVFDGLGQKNVVTWTAMIAAYSQQSMGQKALRLYRVMQEESIIAPDSVTFVCLLQACANLAALHLGRQLHAQIEEQGLQADGLVAVSLIIMYAKSGSMVHAQQVFDALPGRDVEAWNALIAGYTRQGDSDVVFHLFHMMIEDGIQPTGTTLLSVLTVCSHTGLVKKGREYFEAMSRQYGIAPMTEHYTCMVDLLGRAGQLDEALALARTMPVLPDAAVWHNIMGACRKWSNVEIGRHAFDEAVKLNKKDAAAYVSMSNIYRSAQMWEQAQEMQAQRTGIGAWKQPGQSWWTDMDGLVHGFLVGDNKHPEREGIYARLKQLFSKMKEEGTNLNSSCVDPKELILCGHDRKLAMPYAVT